MPYYKIDPMDNDNLTIDHRNNVCTICGKVYTHRKRFHWDGNDSTIKEVVLVTAHPMCRHLINKISEFKQKILEAELELFKIKYEKDLEKC